MCSNIHEKKWLWRYKDYDMDYEDNEVIKMKVEDVNFNK